MRRLGIVVLLFAATTLGAASYPAPVAHDFMVKNFRFASGEVLPEVRIHYVTIGTSNGRNGVLILHGTGGSHEQFLGERFGDVLFKPGGVLDASKFFIIIPDNVGHGRSSKPSDGLHARFPHYAYRDMVELQHRLVAEDLGLTHLRLVMGTSMGAMHSWMWGELWPRMMDRLVPLASNPAEIAGRNRVWRRMLIDDIKNDPDWNGGEYTRQPRGLVSAIHLLLIAGSAPLFWQQEMPTREAADQWLEKQVDARMKNTDANDLLYQVEASRDYDPSPDLEKIVAPLLAINSADDFVNPPELGMMQKAIARVTRGRYLLIPISAKTRGHGTHTLAAIWETALRDFLE